MRRTLTTILTTVLVLAGLASVALASGGTSSVTRGRLERSLPAAFAHVYAQQARLLGHRGVTAASLHARAMCDDGAGNGGPGSGWTCLMSWHDPDTPMPSVGYGEFELDVHSNDCYTAGSPDSLVGQQTMTDARGRTVSNPAHEFDVCFDPDSPASPTGVTFPSALTISTTELTLDAQRKGSVAALCGTGAGGCSGTIQLSAGRRYLGSAAFHLGENTTARLPLPPVPAGLASVDLAVTYRRGVGPAGTTLPVQGR